jgi:hypothetical protein
MCPVKSWVIAERMHDFGSANFGSAVLDVLSNTYHDRWIGRGGPTAWSPRLPDSNSLDFVPMGHLKPHAYPAPVANEEAFYHRIVDACQAILNYAGIFEQMQRSMMNYVQACIESYGGFAALIINYECTPSAVTHKLNVYGHMLIWTWFSCFGMWDSCTKFDRTDTPYITFRNIQFSPWRVPRKRRIIHAHLMWLRLHCI